MCTPDAPTVCVFAEHAGLLSAITPPARRVLASTSALVGLDRAVEVDYTHPPPAGALPLAGLEGHSRAFRTGLADLADVRRQSTYGLVQPWCPDFRRQRALFGDPGAQTAQEAALSLLDRGAAPPATDPAATGTLLDRLAGDPAAARAWMTAYRAAARRCDVPALARLGTP